MIFWSYERLATPKNDCDDFVTKGDYSEPMARLVPRSHRRDALFVEGLRQVASVNSRKTICYDLVTIAGWMRRFPFDRL